MTVVVCQCPLVTPSADLQLWQQQQQQQLLAAGMTAASYQAD